MSKVTLLVWVILKLVSGDDELGVLGGLFGEGEDGDVAVDGFSFGLDDGAGLGVFGGGEKVSAEGLESGEGEEVFFVEVGGDDEESLVVELVEGVIEE